MNPENFGRNLKAAMNERGISQNELARRIGMTAPAVSYIVNGRYYPRVNTLCKILQTIPISFEELVR